MNGWLRRPPRQSKTTRLEYDSFLVFILVVGGFRGNVQGGRGGDTCNGYGFLTDEFMGAIRVGSVRLKPSLNDTKVQVRTGFAAVGKRARMRPPELQKQEIYFFIEVVNLCDGCSSRFGDALLI